MRILVTGASGFVGKNLAVRLASIGHEVTAIATSEAGLQTVSKVMHPGLFGVDKGVFYYQDVIFHMAANNDTTSTDEYAMYKANVTEPVQILEVAKYGRCKKFIYASSTATYGDMSAPYDEEHTPVKPLNVYAKSKADFDKHAMKYATENPEMIVIGLRYCNIYGRGEQHKESRMSMIGQMMNAVRAGARIVLYEHGEQKRDWVYIDDVTDANLLAMNYDKSDIFNIGSGSATTFNRLAYLVMDVMGCDDTRIMYIPNPHTGKYQEYTECKIEKARKLLGYEPKYDIKSGIKEYVRTSF